MPSFDFRRINCFDNIELFSSENENAYFPFQYHDFFCVSLITSGTEILKNTEQDFIAPAALSASLKSMKCTAIIH